MRITHIDTFLLYDPHAMPVQDGTTPERALQRCGRGQLFVHLHTDAGLIGLGMAGASPGVKEVITQVLSPALIGKDPSRISDLWQQMVWEIRDFGRGGIAYIAISALDIALWDLQAKVENVPLYRLLGGEHRALPIYGSGGWTHLSEDALVQEMSSFVERGFTAVKMKVGKGFGQHEEDDLQRVKRVREAIDGTVNLHVDANGAYEVEQAIRLSKKLADIGVSWFEEPVIADDLQGLARIKADSPIPIATGEHEYTSQGVSRVLTMNTTDILQPDAGRIGGVTGWQQAVRLAKETDTPVASHAFQLVHLHLALATPNFLILEYMSILEACDSLWYADVPRPVNGMWAPFKDRPGLGVELSPEALETYSI